MDAFLERVFAKEQVMLCDGGMGTIIQQTMSTLPKPSVDILCLSDPDFITSIHARYVEAGSDLITTNTFNANAAMFAGYAKIADIYQAAVTCARKAGAPYVAAEIGPLGELLEPLGDMSQEEAYALFFEQTRAGVEAGADMFLIETMSDLAETEIAIQAAHDAGNLPVLVSMSFGQGGKTYLGVSPEEAVRSFERLGVCAIGTNCSAGPQEVLSTVSSMAAATTLPLIAQPNAGLPHMSNGEVSYDVDPEDFAASMLDIVKAGATIVGGCCGTEPAHIAALAKHIKR